MTSSTPANVRAFWQHDPARALAATIRAAIGAGAAADRPFEVFRPYSPATGVIEFERAVSHGRGRPRTYDRLTVTIDTEGRINAARLVGAGHSFVADHRDVAGYGELHPFDLLDRLIALQDAPIR